MSFTITVRDVFLFDDKSAVVCGEVTSGPVYIEAGRYVASVGGAVVGEVVVTGERSGGGVRGLRSIGIRGPLRLNVDAIKGYEVSFESGDKSAD